ncbi:hypothetical protein [Erwinia persicina]|nr:hypothetical protein [Erwinia persicina]MBD8161807.1 hypothetical protein [Erwinia persicina]MBD8212750.1 hypothetical protein [Erwinia persicina]
MSDRPVEGDHPDYVPHPGDGKPEHPPQKKSKDDPASAPESGDKPDSL